MQVFHTPVAGVLWVQAKCSNSFGCYLVELLYEDTGVYFIRVLTEMALPQEESKQITLI